MLKHNFFYVCLDDGISTNILKALVELVSSKSKMMILTDELPYGDSHQPPYSTAVLGTGDGLYGQTANDYVEIEYVGRDRVEFEETCNKLLNYPWPIMWNLDIEAFFHRLNPVQKNIFWTRVSSSHDIWSGCGVFYNTIHWDWKESNLSPFWCEFFERSQFSFDGICFCRARPIPEMPLTEYQAIRSNLSMAPSITVSPSQTYSSSAWHQIPFLIVKRNETVFIEVSRTELDDFVALLKRIHVV